MINVAPKKQGIFLENMVFYVSLLLLALAVGGFFYARHLAAQESERLAGLSMQMAKMKSEEQKDLEGKIKVARQKLEDFSKIASQRRSAANFFNKFEVLVPEKIYFSQCNLDLEKMSASLSGHSKTFQDVGRQIMLFESADSVLESANLLKSAINDDGIVDFEAGIALKLETVAVEQ